MWPQGKTALDEASATISDAADVARSALDTAVGTAVDAVESAVGTVGDEVTEMAGRGIRRARRPLPAPLGRWLVAAVLVIGVLVVLAVIFSKLRDDESGADSAYDDTLRDSFPASDPPAAGGASTV